MFVATVVFNFAGVAIQSSKHAYLAPWLFGLGVVCLLFAIVFGAYESIPKPHIVVTGYGRLPHGQTDGLLIENNGEPDYNVTPPDPVPFGMLGESKLVFDDPRITRLTKDNGKQCFPLSIETPQQGNRVNELRDQMAVRGIKHVFVAFKYANGKRPTSLRHTTVCKLERNVKGISAIFVKQKFNWLLLWRD